MKNNFSFNSPEKRIRNNALISDDKFITLINNLSELIKEYYYSSKSNLDEINNIILNSQENNNNNNIISKINYNIGKQQKKLIKFIEKAKDIFKKMKIQKSERKNEINMSLNSNIKNLNLNSVNKKNRLNNTNNKNIIELKITSKYKTEDNNNKIINNTYNAFK